MVYSSWTITLYFNVVHSFTPMVSIAVRMFVKVKVEVNDSDICMLLFTAFLVFLCAVIDTCVLSVYVCCQ